LTEEDIPRLVNAFVKAHCHQQATLEESDKEYTDEYDSNSSETTLADEELFSKGITLHNVVICG